MISKPSLAEGEIFFLFFTFEIKLSISNKYEFGLIWLKSFEKTFHTVDNVPNDAGATRSETDRLRKIFEDMPPFIKITSRRARKTLAIYETLKERRTEALRENLVFKFVR